MSNGISFDVIGTPGCKGSSRAMLIGGRARFIAGGSKTEAAKLHAWDTVVREAARLACAFEKTSTPLFVGAPLHVTLAFRMRRPTSHYGKHGLKPSAPLFCSTKPDLDKLTRATLDSLEGIVFDNDSRVAQLSVQKCFVFDALPEGATISVGRLDGDGAAGTVAA